MLRAEASERARYWPLYCPHRAFQQARSILRRHPLAVPVQLPQGNANEPIVLVFPLTRAVGYLPARDFVIGPERAVRVD